MAKAKIMFKLNGTVHNEVIEGYRISVTTEPDGRAAVIVYDEGDVRTHTVIYRAFERCEITYEQNKVDLMSNDRATGQDPSVRALVPGDSTG